MRRWTNFLRGSVEVQVTGTFPERFLNLCGQRGIVFWGLETVDGSTLRLKVPRQDGKKLEEIGQRTMCQVTVYRQRGLPVFLKRFRRRYALLLGLAGALCVVTVLSRFILTVDVQGNETVSTAVILQELKRLGVCPGVYGPSVNETQVCNDALLNLEDLAWISVNLHGTRAQVLVREKVHRPEIVDETRPAHVVARGSGIILQQEILSGQEMFREGDTVVEGEILISGTVDLPEPAYTQGDTGTLTVRAAGKIYARTWRTLTAVIPLDARVKEYTGEEISAWSVTIFGRRFQILKNGGISYDMYDKITYHKTLTMPGDRRMPLTVNRETVREYTLNTVPINADAGEELLCLRLEERLDALMEEHEGEVVQREFMAVRRDGLLTVTLMAECREQIGETLPFEGQVGHCEPGEMNGQS